MTATIDPVTGPKPERRWVYLRMKWGGWRGVWGWMTGTPGLVVTRERKGWPWRVTHQRSGHALPFLFRTRRDALEYADVLGSVAWWDYDGETAVGAVPLWARRLAAEIGKAYAMAVLTGGFPDPSTDRR